LSGCPKVKDNLYEMVRKHTEIKNIEKSMEVNAHHNYATNH